jgi:hypothetical protein
VHIGQREALRLQPGYPLDLVVYAHARRRLVPRQPAFFEAGGCTANDTRRVCAAWPSLARLSGRGDT